MYHFFILQLKCADSIIFKYHLYRYTCFICVTRKIAEEEYGTMQNDIEDGQNYICTTIGIFIQIMRIEILMFKNIMYLYDVLGIY